MASLRVRFRRCCTTKIAAPPPLFQLWVVILLFPILSSSFVSSLSQNRPKIPAQGTNSNGHGHGLAASSLVVNKEYDVEFDQQLYDGDDDFDTTISSDDDTKKKNGKSKRLIEITSSIELPFSAEVAYDAYLNLPRQPHWSSWLKSVKILDNRKDDDDDTVRSRWTSKVMGFSYSWDAISIKNVRPHMMKWKSVTGLQNQGIVRFYKKKGSDSSYQNGPTLMTIKISFLAPRAVSALFNRSKKLTNFVDKQMIRQSLSDFRRIISKENGIEEEQQR